MSEEELKIVISAQSDKLKGALKDATNQVSNFEKSTTTATSSMTTGFKKLGAVIGKVFAIGVIVKFGKTCVDVATQTQNAWIGLNSILTGKTGTTEAFNQAKSFINDYVKDGLVPLNNAVASYKNLALRGYNSDQIEKTMNALKNSATFARQSTYSLGEAVQTATEGLKNENSVVVDNAGITKNVAKMWEDYAKSVGKTTSALTQQEKIEAEVNGILEETKFQSKDAELYTQTYSGALARLNTSLTEMKTAIGEVIQPLAKLFIPIITTCVNAITSLFRSISGLLSLFGFTSDLDKVSGQISGVGEATENLNEGLEDTATSSKKAKKGLASFDEIDNLQTDTSVGGGVGATIGELETMNATLTKTESAVDNIFNGEKLKPLIDSIEKLKNAMKPLSSKVGQGLSNFYKNTLVPLGNYTISDLLPSFFNTLADSLNYVSASIDYSSPAWNWLRENILAPTGKFAGKVVVGAIDGIGGAFQNATNYLKQHQSKWEEYWNSFPQVKNTLDNFFNAVLDIVSTLWNVLKKFFGNIEPYITAVISNLGLTLKVIVEVVNGVIEALTGVLQFVSGVFSVNFAKTWEGIKTTFKGIWDGITAIVKGAINGIIWSINKMIGGLETALNVIVDMINRIEIRNPFTDEEIWSPHLTRMNFSRIPQLERGGIVDSTTTFIAGEHGKEAIIPLENNTEWLDKVASRIVVMSQAMNGLGNNAININVPVELDGKEIAKATIRDLNLEAQRQGYKPILV